MATINRQNLILEEDLCSIRSHGSTGKGFFLKSFIDFKLREEFDLNNTFFVKVCTFKKFYSQWQRQFCGIKKLDLPNFPTSCRYALFRVAVRLHISCRRASESGRVGDARRFTETGPRKIWKDTQYTVCCKCWCNIQVSYYFPIFFVRIKFVTSRKRNTTCELIGFAVSPRWNEAIKVTTALCRVGQQVPELQHVFWETWCRFFFKAQLLHNQLNFLERKNLPKQPAYLTQ